MTQESQAMWQKVALFLAGIIVAGVGSFAAYPRNIVTRDELPGLVASYATSGSQYTKDSADLRRQLDDQSHEIGEMRAQMQQLQVDVARISERLGVPPARISK
jgi:hypothetical protein